MKCHPNVLTTKRNDGDRNTKLWIPSLVFTLVILILFIVSLVMENSPWAGLYSNETKESTAKYDNHQNQHDSPVDFRYIVPKPLIDNGVYNESEDFVNERGIRPTYWHFKNTRSWGPCIPPLTSITDWQDRRNFSTSTNGDNVEDFVYLRSIFEQQPRPPSTHNSVEQAQNDFETRQQKLQRGGGCRPGFLIIGAGKCGTSSLYHYLIGHPRVLPAFEKQIHYFKYFMQKPLAWYYSFFPTPQSFLEHGGLMTGEASPGYLPYPQVVKDVFRVMNQPPYHDQPKIIMIGRSPLERMYSSYRYNYVYPTLEYLRTGKHRGVPKDLIDAAYQPYLFSLESFVRTELAQLKACLTWVDHNNIVQFGFGANKTLERWYKQPEFRDALLQRNQNTSNTVPLRQLIDLDAICYGAKVNSTVLRRQWAEMQTQEPNKVIVDKNLHLTQAMIGRGLYTFPLEWWYLVFDPSDIFFVCTEELSDPDILQELALNLGLPSYNFTQVVSEGAYNVGAHRGYDKATTWEELKAERDCVSSNCSSVESGNGKSESKVSEQSSTTSGIPIPLDLYQELHDFVRPYNERLFELTGKACKW
jgi:hypothetical protein